MEQLLELQGIKAKTTYYKGREAVFVEKIDGYRAFKVLKKAGYTVRCDIKISSKILYINCAESRRPII